MVSCVRHNKFMISLCEEDFLTNPEMERFLNVCFLLHYVRCGGSSAPGPV